MASSIEWADETWNPVTGCSKVSAGCKNCYAEGIAKRFWGGRKFTDVRLHPDRLDKPLRWRKPRRIFVNSMSDLFHEDVPTGFAERIFEVMQEAFQHTYLVLTKRPERMRVFVRDFLCEHSSDAPAFFEMLWPNVWLGTSIEDTDSLCRLEHLNKTHGHSNFLSLEPLLGPLPYLDLSLIDWVIVGSESGPKARPMELQWVRDIRDRCNASGVPFFLKQIVRKGRKVPFEEWPDDLRIREMPELTTRSEA